MSSRNKIYQALDENSRGDVSRYFHHLCTMLEENSGTHEYNITSSDCYNNNAPFKADQFTRFNLTNSMDIVDISKGFITMRVNVDVQFLYDNLHKKVSNSIYLRLFTYANVLNSYPLSLKYFIISGSAFAVSSFP